MQNFLVVLLMVGALLLVSMMYATASLASPRSEPELLLQQFGRLQGSQMRLEMELQQISSKLDRLAQHPTEHPAALDTPSGKAALGSAAAAARAPHPTAGSDAECPGRRPFHAIMTAQSSPYQQWQARIMYFHWKKQAAAAGPCGEMAGFTRLCATAGGKPDGLQDEIPSVFTTQLSAEIIASHFHFGVK